MKKKFLKSGIVMLVMASMMMTGCGGSGSSDTSGENAEGGETVQEEKAASDVTIEEQVLLEEEGLTVTATGVEVGNGYECAVMITVNNTTDKEYAITASLAIINGYQGSAHLAPMDGQIFGAGETEGAIFVLPMQMKYANIDQIGEIIIRNLCVREMEVQEIEATDGTTTESYVPVGDQSQNPLYRVEECVLQTSAYDEAMISVLPEGEVVYDKDGVKVVKVAADEDDKAQMITELFFIKNDSDKVMTLNSYDFSINGTAIDDMMITMSTPSYVTVYPGCINVGYFGMVEESMEYMGLEGEFEALECTMSVSEVDEYGYPKDGTIETFEYSYTAE